MNKHTPAPWHLSGSKEYVRKDDKPGWPAWNIAELNTATEAFEANAHLIAAAPDLLDACEALADFTRDLLKLVTPEQIKEARLTTRMLKLSDQGFKAMAKARGEK